jgi:hypothetical protein
MRVRRREILRAGAVVAGGYALGVSRVLPATAGLLDRGDITLAQGTSRPSSLTVPAGHTLRFDPDRNVTLELRGNLVVHGTLEMKPKRGVRHVLRFVGIDEEDFVGGGMRVLDSDVGLWVMGHGKLDIRGDPRAGWNRTGSDPTWKPNDEILTTPFEPGDYTTFAPYQGASAGSPGGLATVTGPDGRVFTQEAFNLTRSVRIEGTRRGRTHIFIRSSAPQSILYAAIRHVGPRKATTDPQVPTASVLGRYGLHFHMCGKGSRGSRVEGTVVRDCGSHAFVPHMSDGVTFTDCVAHGTNEDAYWWDPGTTTNETMWMHCLAARLVPIPAFRGSRLAGFNLGNGTGNALVDSVVVGNQGNKQAAGFIWPESGSGVWLFQDCVAHNNKRDGLFVWQNTVSPHKIEDFAAFRNGYGIEHGAYHNVFDFERCVTFENARGLLIHALSASAASGPLRWIDSSFQDGLLVSGHTLAATEPALFVDSPCAAVIVDERQTRVGGAYDFVRTGLEPADWTVSAMDASSVYRVQREDSSAYRVNPDGTTTPIEPFA